MNLNIQQMSLQEYAELQSRLGAKVISRNGHYWRRVRPFFYRPLLPVEVFDGPATLPPVPWPSGHQYVIPNGEQANSTMNFLLLDDLGRYSLENMRHKRRQLIKRAAQHFEVRPLTDPRQLKQLGHAVYLSFLERTGYHYKSDRKSKPVFDQWVDTLFGFPQTILLGGFGKSGLEAISTSYWVGHFLVYSTLICSTESLHKNIGELIFHEIRMLTARQPGIREILVRSYQGGNSIDQYYLSRGCHLAKMPARLVMPSSLQHLLRWFIPRKYELLRGDD